MLVGNAVAFNRFLDGLLMRPGFEPAFFYINNTLIVSFRKRGRKIPGDHHFYIIVFAVNFCDPVQVFRFEILSEEFVHQHSNTESDGIYMLRTDPLLNERKKLPVIPGKGFRA